MKIAALLSQNIASLSLTEAVSAGDAGIQKRCSRTTLTISNEEMETKNSIKLYGTL